MCLVCLVYFVVSVSDPHHFDEDRDPGLDLAFHFDADPDPAFHFDADTDPASQNDADPDLQHWLLLFLTFK
jgi:hypothetical protein